MDYTLLESHRQHFRENYNLAKAAIWEGKERKAKACLDLALEHCQFIIDHSNDVEERKRYKALRKKCKAVISDAGASPKASESDDDSKSKSREEQKTTKAEEKDSSIVVIRPDPITLDEALKRLDELIGLDEVKQKVHDWVKQIKVFKLRKLRGIKVPDISYHMVFTGNPGTGKTTVARLMAQIYCALGILSEGQLVEVDRAGLVAGYVGQTAAKTKEVLRKAYGGALFIDESYSLANGGTNDFGQEAIDTILKEMEDKRDNLVVIVAGYDAPMEKFISSNPGLRSRFKNFIQFSDYNGEELFNIFVGMCRKNQYHLNEEARIVLRGYFDDLYEHRGKNFGNGRDVRNLFETIVTKQSVRVAGLSNPDNHTITEIREEDLPLDE